MKPYFDAAVFGVSTSFADFPFLSQHLIVACVQKTCRGVQLANSLRLIRMSAKKGSASKTASGDDVVITGSRRATVVKVEPTSSSQGRKTRGGGAATRASRQSADAGHPVGILVMALSNLNLSVFPKDGTVLPVGSTFEVIQALQGGLLRVSSFIFS